MFKYKSEEIFINNVEKCLKQNGCNTWREVKPDNSRHRVDLIFYRKDFGFIGAEGKNINTLGCGGVISDAVKQIEKYKKQTYFNGKTIDKWCLLVPTETTRRCIIEMNRVLVFVRHFLKKQYNILLLEYQPYKKVERIVIDYGCKNSIYMGKGYCRIGEKNE